MRRFKKAFVMLMACVMSMAFAVTAHAEEDVKAEYSGFFYGSGFGAPCKDNTRCTAPAGSYLTGMKATLVNQPEGVTGTIVYQANLSGSGWLDWVDNNDICGSSETNMPLEAVRVSLNGQLAELYDVYTMVYQNGQWSQWAVNGATAGQEGMGLRLWDVVFEKEGPDW